MCLKIGDSEKQIHTEHTCGICTSTPPIECCSGCGTASGIGPVVASNCFIVIDLNLKKREK